VRLLKLLPAIALVATSVFIGASAANADPGHLHNASTYVCSGGNIPPGSYGSVIVTGTCYIPSGVVNVARDLTVAPNALLDNISSPAGQQIGNLPGDVHVGGNINVGPGSILFLGCDVAINCPNGATNDTVGGNITGIGALGIVVHATLVHGNVTMLGGGGGPALVNGAQSGTCLGNFATKTPPPVPALWASDPALANGEGPGVPLPVYSDFEDNQINGSLSLIGLQSCWLGALRNQIGGNVLAVHNIMGDPDANEIEANSIEGSIACFANNITVQFGDAAQGSNIVDGSAFGQCAFNALQPDPTANPGPPPTPAGPLTPISVKATGPEGGPGDPS
jgi:hypothetical protein